MKRARVAYAGAIHTAYEHPQGLRLADGRVLTEDQVVWLPPFTVGTVIALGLNYAEHAKELSFDKQSEPLAFLKAPQALIGHNGQTRRPDAVEFMHYECELAVVIGKTCKNVPVSQALDYVGGYTVANDYAIRDYLENWYRPNLRVKNRDTCTAIGPWLVDAGDIADPNNLALSTHVNHTLTQSGNTSDMVFNVAELVAYLSSFMTLAAGDVILTGTPHGVVNVKAGDKVSTEIEHVGKLVNHIVGDAAFGLA